MSSSLICGKVEYLPVAQREGDHLRLLVYCLLADHHSHSALLMRGRLLCKCADVRARARD